MQPAMSIGGQRVRRTLRWLASFDVTCSWKVLVSSFNPSGASSRRTACPLPPRWPLPPSLLFGCLQQEAEDQEGRSVRETSMAAADVAMADASVIDRIYKGVLSGLEEPAVFSEMDLTKCEGVMSLKRMQGLSPIKALLRLFSSVGFAPRLGFNMGSGDISFTFPLPTEEMIHGKKDRLQSVVYAMLGLLPHQADVEALHAARSPASSPLLANMCLAAFSKQSGAAIAGNVIDFRQGNLRVSVCPLGDTHKYSAAGRTALRYSPAYTDLSGYTSDPAADQRFSATLLAEQKAKVVKSLLAEFWQMMEQQRYMADDELQTMLTERLTSYFMAGIRGQAQGFLPVAEKLSLYLHGTAGIGKSTFVKTFCAALEQLLQKRLDPEKRVQIVKVPLNSLTPANLRSILHVRGISDISIERIIEQTLVKGGIVVFHLEENPEDEELQEQLYDRSQAMLKVLLRRYSEFSSNVITVYTSNYLPVKCIADTSSVLHIQPPSADKQRLWCMRNLQHRLVEVLPTLASAAVELQVNPPYTTDLRPLEQWWMSTGFHVSTVIAAKLAATGAESAHADVIVRALSGSQNLSIAVTVDGEALEPLELHTHNAFFFFRAGAIAHGILTDHGIPLQTQPTVLTIVDMMSENYLKPGVLVLTGDEFLRERYTNAMRVYMQDRFGDRLRGTAVELMQEDDKVKVFGKPNEIQGGLFKFIASVNNPNACAGRTDLVALVLVDCNETGQFIIRELLECSQSRTHRQAVAKDRVLFVLSVEGDITAQIVSRAHSLLHCTF